MLKLGRYYIAAYGFRPFSREYWKNFHVAIHDTTCLIIRDDMPGLTPERREIVRKYCEYVRIERMCSPRKFVSTRTFEEYLREEYKI